MQNSPKSDNNKAILFLADPRYRFWRHFTAVILIALIAVNVGVVIHRGSADATTGMIVRDILFFFSVYIAAMYVNLRVLVPRWLMKNNYWRYLLAFTGLVLGVVAANFSYEYLIFVRWGAAPGENSYFSPNSNPWVDATMEFLVFYLCLFGTSLSVLLRQWMLDADRKENLEKMNLQQQAEEIRNRVNPEFLYGILDRAAACARFDPEESSAMLIRLSRFLRYQLYDSSRKWVFLHSELTFLDNYLQLDSMHRGFTFSLSEQCGNKRLPVLPMIFFPVVRYLTEFFPASRRDIHVELLFHTQANRLCITGRMNAAPELSGNSTTGQLRQRLNILFPGNYRFEEVHRKDELVLYVEIPIRHE